MDIFLTGDSRFFWAENIKDFVTLPLSWDASLNTGIGKSALGSLWVNSYLNLTASLSNFGLSWETIGLLFWILPSIFLSFFSAFYLFKTLFPDSKHFGFLAGVIYLTNTYFLMILTGGQLGVALSYSLAPLVFLGFIKIIHNSEFIIHNSILAGLLLALQVLFDPRITFITLLAAGLYWLFFRRNIIFVFLIPSFLAALLHSYWLLPLLLAQATVVPENFKSLSGFEFFSFADFSHALSLLHPNWPENIFGKTYFLQPEFLLLPIVAFSSLLFINNRTIKQLNNRHILFFSLLALLGAFLAKGANPPFGEINTFLFQYFPGMSMFRDPTKFYLLVALSYSVLIPFSLYKMSILIKPKTKNQKPKTQSKYQIFNFSYVFLIFAILYLIFLVRPLWFGELKNKFRPREIPQEYVQLKDFLVSQPEFFRTLWIPQWQRYGFFSNNHPAVGRFELFKQTSASGQIKELISEGTQTKLQDLGIKYIIVPYDSEGEIFLEDRKYDEEEYQQTIDQLKMVTWLKWLNGFGKIAIFEVSGSKDYFWSPSTGLRMNYNFLNPTEYKVEVKNAQKGDILVFSEGFDKNWIAETTSGIKYYVSSSKYKGFLNSFVLQGGDYELKVHYSPQKWVNIGLVITATTILTVFGLLRFRRR